MTLGVLTVLGSAGAGLGSVAYATPDIPYVSTNALSDNTSDRTITLWKYEIKSSAELGERGDGEKLDPATAPDLVGKKLMGDVEFEIVRVIPKKDGSGNYYKLDDPTKQVEGTHYDVDSSFAAVKQKTGDHTTGANFGKTTFNVGNGKATDGIYLIREVPNGSGDYTYTDENGDSKKVATPMAPFFAYLPQTKRDNEDKLIYDVHLISFSIQNTELLTKYKNIRYRVISTLDNAIEIKDGTPKNNGEIANGTYIDKPGGTGAEYSEGVMESVISDTGQVFVPVIMNVYGAENGQKLRPEFKLEIVDATNVESGDLETFNNQYDSSALSKLKVADTIVSAKPSVGVQMVAGEVVSGTTVGVSASSVSGYDVGVTTALKPLPGRASGDYRGSTYPKGAITYTIKLKGTYQRSGTTYTMNTSQYTPMYCHGYAAALKTRSTADWTKILTVQEGDFKKPLAIPHGITKGLYTSQPTGDLSKIGVYDSGKFSGGNTTTSGTPFSNTGYAGVLNPYTYNMTGNRTQSATDKSFSSLEVVYAWDKTTTYNLGSANGWNRYDMSLYIDSVSYDGLTTATDTSVTYPTIITGGGGYVGGPIFTKATNPDKTTGMISLDLNHTWTGVNTGNSRLNQGDSIYLSNFNMTTNPSVQELKAILMWDASAFEYDQTRKPLTGEKFVDSSGDSLIKTDSNGKYKFENLPEGEYLAEFMIGDLVVQKIVIVTKDHIGSDPKLNSNLLDRDGNVLFSIEQKSDKIGEIENIITYGTITEEQIKDIQRILTRNEPCYDWYDDDLEGTLEYFGNEIVRLNDLMRFTKKYNDILVNYNIYSSDEEDEESESDDLCDLDFYEVGSITREVIENNLVQKLLEHQEWDTIEMKIIENGQMDSYLLEFEERKE